ncbi:hypothetical protein [Acetobacteroides hydrogenigenes]|uniref:Uncharacterized protein n=1 Tax=Acetobacteroides hydrogenigenes TaxID=979970 RepID=A0A4R2EW41_9BACT|nr:hypothetical protein [Acetobacteroides hydrogenigenes]TCN72868.1 hypothetical protein CLV25_10186 [Acetobacteroides hydrogenigenes]
MIKNKRMNIGSIIIWVIVFLVIVPLINKGFGQLKAQSNPDTPVGFGYKIMWIAVKTDSQELVAQTIGLKKTKPSNWKNGIDKAYKDAIFITPVIDNWTLIVGMGLPTGDSKESIDQVSDLLNRLSKQFGEAQFFCTHRVVEYHCWIKSTNGKIDRIYSYLGERGENIVIKGQPTEIEKKYNLIDTFSEEAKKDNYFDREDLVFPDEQLVMTIAGNWSIDPTLLDKRTDIKGLGLISK